MQIRSLYLSQFRNYDEAFFEFHPRFNFIYGANAQGKTSILEALYYLMMGRSFRSHQSNELIKHGFPTFYIEAYFLKHQVEQKLRISFDGKERKIIYHSTPLPSVSSLIGLIQGTVMTPDDVQLIKGSPLLRRQFLDIHIAQIDPLYVHHLTRYNRAMRQRNQLLKAQQLATIESWEQEMSHSAAYLIKQRYLALLELQPLCQQAYAELTEESPQFQLTYTASFGHLPVDEIRHVVSQQMLKNRRREMLLGSTLSGPHKDDIILTIGQQDARSFASEGQQRSCITALRLAEWQRLSHLADEPPMMMIDDLGMGLDGSRRQRLLHKLEKLGQVFLTTTDSQLLSTLSLPSIHTFQISEGTILNKS